MANDSAPVLANRLKLARKKTGFTQAKIATLLNIEIGTLSGYERGYRRPSTDMLAGLAQLYGVSTDYLLGRVDSPTDSLIPITTEPLDPSIERMNDPVMDGIMDNLQLMSPEERETFWRLSQSVVNRTTKGVS